MALALVPILMLIVGLLLYATTGDPWKEFGRWLGLAGAIGLGVAYATHMVNVGNVAVALLAIIMLVVGLMLYATTQGPPPKDPWREFGRWIGFGGAVGIAIAYATHMVKIG